MNKCKFSDCRKYRYALIHTWDDGLFAQELKILPWIGLNPSTADEFHLDNTLKRVKTLSGKWGYTGFAMLNLFAYRSTKPKDMKAAPDLIGPENDAILRDWASRSPQIVAAWGKDGKHQGRVHVVCSILKAAGTNLYCIKENEDGSPFHPLYAKNDSTLKAWTPKG